MKALLDGRPRRQDGVLAQDTQGRTVLLRVDDGSYYSLDDVGAVIWQLCDGRSVGEIVAAVCDQFEVSPEIVEADVLEFVAELRQERLLVDST